jgi:adenylate cyclase
LRYLFEDYAFDTDRRELRRVRDLIRLTPQVFDLLDYLLRNRERVVSKDDLVATIWGGRIVSDSALTTRINAVRAAIGDNGKTQRLIKTLPRKGFRFVGTVREEQKPAGFPAEDTATRLPRPVLAPPHKPSVAVLPFVGFQDDPRDEYFSDGMTEDIIAELSRFSELFVIARNSSFQYKGNAVDISQIGRELGARYVLKGSIRRQGERVRIVAQLIDTQTNAQHWAERYDRELQDILTVQDEVARAIATILVVHVNKAEMQRTLLKPPKIWQAYDCYLRGANILAAYWSSVSIIDLRESRRLLEKSISIDPDFARAYSTLSTTYVIAWLNRLDGDHLETATLDRAHQLASRAIQLDPNLPQARASLGAVLVWQRQHDAAISEFEKALALNPNFTDWRIAIALVYAGESAKALEILEKHMRLDPFYVPLAPHWVGLACYTLKRYSQALSALKECALRAPNYKAVHVWLAATYARLGQMDDARAEVAKVLQLDPDFTIERTARTTVAFKYAADSDHCFEGMRTAGLPSC